MADIDSGRVNIVIVYKVDRFTRSLADFAKLVEKFDQHDVSFVSVTQAFNTSNSMGRLTLNVLLSFTQFEREVGAERVRDKIAASRKKGIWTGGVPPLGYDQVDKKLVVNTSEAEVVRSIYALYGQYGCVRTIIRHAKKNGWHSKKHNNGSGGYPLTRGPIYYVLKNPVYTGLLKSSGNLYEGQHEPFISQDQWYRVQDKLQERAQRNGKTKHKISPLGGLLYWGTELLTPDHTTKSGKRYRYYISRPDGQIHNRIRLKADDMELTINKALSSWLTSPEIVMNDMLSSGGNTATLQNIKDAVNEFSQKIKNDTLNDGFTKWLGTIIQIDLNEKYICIILSPQKLFNDPAFHSVIKDELIITSSCTHKKREHETSLILGEQTITPAPDNIIINNLLLAHRLKAIRFDHPDQSWLIALKKEGIDPSISHRFLRYAFLAPDIVEAFLYGTTSIEVTAEPLKTLPELPACWDAQRQLFGMSSHSSTE